MGLIRKPNCLPPKDVCRAVEEQNDLIIDFCGGKKLKGYDYCSKHQEELEAKKKKIMSAGDIDRLLKSECY